MRKVNCVVLLHSQCGPDEAAIPVTLFRLAREYETAVVVVTAEFEHLAHTMAANGGRAGLRVHVLPYPLESRPEGEVRQIALDHWPQLLATIGAQT